MFYDNTIDQKRQEAYEYIIGDWIDDAVLLFGMNKKSFKKFVRAFVNNVHPDVITKSPYQFLEFSNLQKACQISGWDPLLASIYYKFQMIEWGKEGDLTIEEEMERINSNQPSNPFSPNRATIKYWHQELFHEEELKVLFNSLVKQNPVKDRKLTMKEEFQCMVEMAKLSSVLPSEVNLPPGGRKSSSQRYRALVLDTEAFEKTVREFDFPERTYF